MADEFCGRGSRAESGLTFDFPVAVRLGCVSPFHREVFVGEYAVDDGACAVVLVGGALAALAFVVVGDVAAFHEDGGAAGLVQHGEVLALSGLTVLEFESA